MVSPTFAARPLAAFVASTCIACAALVGSNAFAQAAPPAPSADARARPPTPPMGPGGPGMHGMHRMHSMHELERLKTSLRLDARQAGLWDRAVEQMKPPADMREQMKSRHERMTAMLDDPNFDPRKAAAEMDRMESERAAHKKTVRESWFAVYDSLNPVQRGQAREFLRSRLAHMGGMRERMMHWRDHDEGRKGMAPPAPPAPPAK